MAGKKTDLLQGTLDLPVLKALALGPLHGPGVSHSTNDEGSLPGQTGLHLPRLTPDGGGGLAQIILGRVSKQAPGQVLLPHQSRAMPT